MTSSQKTATRVRQVEGTRDLEVIFNPTKPFGCVTSDYLRVVEILDAFGDQIKKQFAMLAAILHITITEGDPERVFSALQAAFPQTAAST